ncbi:MAG: hypothetical protein WC906_04315 [Parcubacteria group bacterium]|jgi:hypothetical protein
MFEQKKENTNHQEINAKDQLESIGDGNIVIHTMQEDLDALSGIFPKKEKSISPEENKAEKNAESGEKMANEKHFNPFLDKQYPKQMQDKIEKFVSKDDVSASNNEEKESDKLKEPSRSASFAKKAIWIIVVVAMIIIFSIGGYYFWISGKFATNVSDKIQEKVVEKIEEDKVEIESVPKYSVDKPNYLSINMKDQNYENFKNLVIKTSFELKNLGIDRPVEFIITDSENNPISFSQFNAIIKIALPGNLLENFSEKFSVFISNDSGISQIGLSVDLSNEAKSSLLMKNEETKLLGELSPLLLGNITLPEGRVLFKDNIYKGVDVRYFNLTENGSTAIDYAFVDNKLMFGTSKNSTWAIVDKLLDGIN